MIDEVASGKYDICIGAFRRTSKAETIVNFTAPIILDATSVIYKEEAMDDIGQFTSLVYGLRFHILGFIILGILFGLILFLVDSKRTSHQRGKKFTKFDIKGKKINKSHFFRSIITGISSVFGEMGYLAERATLNTKGLFIVILLMIICTIFLMYIQGEITRILVDRPEYSITQKNIRGKKILGLEGSSDVEELKKYGAEIVELKDKSMEDMIEMYMKSTILSDARYQNTQTYDGCACSYLNAYPFTLKYPLTISPSFGYYGICFIYNKEFDEEEAGSIYDINISIAQLRDSLELKDICEDYFSTADDVPICD